MVLDAVGFDGGLDDVGKGIPAPLLNVSCFLLCLQYARLKIQQPLMLTTFSATFTCQHNLGEDMKSILTLAALVAFTTTATAGSFADPMIEAPIIVEDASSSISATTTVALLALLMVIPILD